MTFQKSLQRCAQSKVRRAAGQARAVDFARRVGLKCAVSSESFTSLAWLRRRLRPEEALLALFMLALIWVMNQTGRGLRLEFHLVYGFLCFGLVAGWMIWRREGSGPRALRFARDFAPFVGCVLIYENLHEFLAVLPLTDRTAWALRADLWLFGSLPAYWFDRWINDTTTAVMVAFYSTYYVVPPLVAVVLYKRRQEMAFRNLMLAVVLTQCLGYVGYLCVPVDPPFEIAKRLATVDRPLHAQLGSDGPMLAALLSAISDGPWRTPRDCFPSLHTALMLVTAVSAWRHARGWFWAVLPCAAGLLLATQYLRVHFVVDLFAGAALAVFTLWLAPRLNAKWIGDARHEAR
jgi:membrane-associated phospholipid phosphatase